MESPRTKLESSERNLSRDEQYLVESGFAHAQESPQADLTQTQPTGIWGKIFSNPAANRYFKTAGAAVCLVGIGLTFIIIALVDGFSPDGKPSRAVAFMAVGVLCALPGGYQCWVFYQLWKRRNLLRGPRFTKVIEEA